MRSILEIAQEAAERDATAPAPQALFNTNDRIAKILRTAAHDVMRHYLRVTGWTGNSDLHSTWAFSLLPGKYAYALPPDFLRVIPETEQRNGWAMGLVGPATPQQWSWWLTGLGAVAAPLGWRIKNNALWIEPTPSEAELVTIEYISKYPVVSYVKAGDYNLRGAVPVAESPFVPRDGHITEIERDILVPDHPNDAEYGEDGAGYEEGQWPDDPHEILKRLHPLSGEAPLPQVRRPFFEADEDMPAFSDDYMLSLGMTFQLQRALGLPYAERAAEFEHEMEVRANTDAGSPRGFTMGSRDTGVEAWPVGDGRWLIS